MQLTDGGNDNNKHPNSNGQIDHDTFLTESSNFGIDYWRNRLATAAPTIFPSRSSSHSIIDGLATRRFLFPDHYVHLDHGISPKAIVTLAYGLVLRAHADASKEVVFAYVDYSNGTNGSTTSSPCPATSSIQNIRFDWNRTILDSLKTVQDDIILSENEQLFNAGKSAIPAEIASLFRTVLFFHAYSPIEAKMHKVIGVDYDLGFNVNVIDSGEIAVEARFASKHVSTPEIETFLDHFEVAMKNILFNLTNPLSEVELNSPHEQQRLITDINPIYPHQSLSHASNVSQLIEEQTTKTPHKVALQVDQNQFITYKQLDAFANDVGHILLSNGLKHGELVGIYMDKSCEMFISILGIHKAGCVYVPLDPLHPSERIQTILRIANIRIVLTSKEFLSHLETKNYDDIKLLPIDIADLSPAIKPNVLVSREDVSHVLFTSGSTGIPKGVILTHGSIIESIFGSREVFGPLNGRVLQFANYTFDVSVWDWCGTLSAGGTLCVVPRQSLMDNLEGVADSLDITFLETTPTVMALISPEKVPTLQMLAPGGEPLTQEVRNKWANVVNVVNVYGPTEASTNVTALKWVTLSTELPNIGRPFGLNVIYVLDERLRPVPLGCVGELFIGGPQVARGYLGAPEQTAKAFVNDPFRPGSTMYASGDLVRMSPVDYSIAYLSRRDTQIKIRGLRIEIGEIETVLKSAGSSISNAAVIKVDAGGENLVAFLEFSSNTGADAVSIVHEDNRNVTTLVTSLRSAARQRLAPYMVPSIYIPLNRFPLASSGKLDRKALTAFFYAHQDEIRDLRLDSGEGSSVEGPRDQLQATIRSLWASILNIAEDLLSIDADFFAVGGDSISAIRLGSAARDAGIHLQTTDIIQNPTILEMARVALTAVVDYKFDDDEIPSVTLDGMKPEDLTLLDIDQSRLNNLRKELLSKHGLLATDVLDIYPCTALQTSFLAAGLFANDAYIIRQIYDLPAGSNSHRIREAFANFINHPNGTIFRTTFVFDETMGRYLQIVTRPFCRKMVWNTIDVDIDAALDEAIRKYQFGRGCQKFEPGELMIRACIFEVKGVARALVWSLHHAVADHWSINNAEFDIADMYFQRPLSHRRSFKPMIKYLHCLDRTASLEFWNKHLLDANPTPFPESVPDSSRTIANTVVSRDMHADHASFTRQFGVTAASLATVAWSVVLAAHTSSSDVVFGQVVAGRNAPIKDIEIMAGNTINTVAHRVVLKPEATILDTLLAIQREQTEISKHEHIDLAELRLQGTAAASLFKTLLNFTNLPGDQRSPLDGLNFTAESHLWIRRLGSYDGQDVPFTLTIIPMTEDGFYIEANYNDRVLLMDEVSVILDHFESALRFMIESPRRLVIDIELINEQEMQLLVPPEKSVILELNGDSNHSHDNIRIAAQSVSRLIELQAERTHQRIALQFGQDVFMTYGQMNLLSNNLAQKLIKSGIERGNLVAIYMDKSIEMFLSILAIHKAGGAYVPLDPEHPMERINTILCLSKAAMVLTTKDLQPQLVNILAEAEANSIVVDFTELVADANPNVHITRDDISHVLFTSGSTGVPKGVVLAHGSILDSALGSVSVVGRLDGRILQFSNYTFDLSVWDWACTLCGGGTLCIVPKQKLIDDLGGVAKSLDITFLQTTPTVGLLISPEEVPSLQVLLLGGEVLTTEVRNAWADTVTLMNGYGPTEASTYVAIMKKVTSSTGLSNIGRPFGLNVAYILDESLRPVPLGCIGELFIGGPQVARGYLGAPEQTFKVFIDDPFRPGSMMYASGDLVRMSPVDHTITYLGRRDTQIKIRGLRIEVGEIEAVLKEASAIVGKAVVIKVNLGRECLVAFVEVLSHTETHDIVVVHEGPHFDGSIVTSLRHAARQKLPPYMVPSIFVPINRFPLSSSGKLDRKSLNAFFYAHEEEIKSLSLDSDQLLSLEVPHDELQATLRSLWASTLDLKEDLLGIDDDFFIVGGDSILAIRLASAARDAGLSLPVTDIVRNPTIRCMAQIVRSAISDNKYDDDETPTITLDKMRPQDLTLLTLKGDDLNSLRNDLLLKYGLSASDVLDVYPSTAPQTSFLLAGMIVHDAYIVTISWDLPPNTSVTRLQETFDNFVNHPNGMMLRTVFVFHPASSKWLQVIIKPERRRLEWNIITVEDETELPSRVLQYEQNRGSQQFEDGQLFTRVCIFQLNGYARVLVWTLHHALVDHWTLEHMVADIDNIFINQPLPSRRSFKPMIKYLQQIDHVSGVEFWRNHLCDALPTLFLQNRLNARRVTANTIMYRHIKTIDISLLTRRFGIMPSTLITCAWSVVLSAHTNTTNVVFGQVLSGRSAPIKDIGVMTGIMINTVARRIIFSPTSTVLETLQQIQSEQIAISKHENISLAELQAEGIPVSTLFDTILNFRNKGFNKVTEHDSKRANDSLFASPRTEGRDRLDYPFALDIDLVSTDGISIRAQHATEYIVEAEVNTFLDHFESALHFLITNPQSLITDVELVNERERQLLIPPEELTPLGFKPYEYNLRYFSNDTTETVLSLIELQAEKTPQRIALQFCQDVFLTYAQMNSLSNNLARRLIATGVKPGKLVALYMDKSIEMFLSILAIHKSGGGYVPLDPEHPADRISTIIRLSDAATVLTSKELEQRVASILVGEISLMIVDHTELSTDIKPVVHVTRDDISHVLFTSGSTGVPKGVVLTHGSMLASTLGSLDVIGRLDGRVLQFSNYTFDLSVWDWACTLTGGGTLCVVPKQELIDDLNSVAKNFDATFMQTTPTVAALTSPEEVPSLRTLLLGGEVLSHEIRNAWAEAVTLMNGYGPTEASTYVAVMKQVTSSTGLSNIGRPFGLNVTYVLDERLRPVPLGCIGELFIGGPQVARGYLGSPEQTAKVFVSDPFRPGSTMYASGDLVRVSPIDHTITYLGRRDTQVKIRGLRIEIGEIETVLKEASLEIENAAVMKVDTGNENLVAFLEYPSIVSDAEDIIIVHEDQQIIGTLITSLRRVVLQKLPPYMVPNIYVPLNRFPLSSSGKLDRKSLTTFFHAHDEEIRNLQFYSEQLSSLEAPQNELQVTLRSLWALILNLKENLLGIDDDFFIAGGDSISAIRLASAARDAGLSLPVSDVIRNPTIRQMAQVVQSATPDDDDDDETLALTLDKMLPEDLTLLTLDSVALDSLRNDLLPKYGLSPSDVLDIYPPTALQTSFLLTGMIVHDAYIVTMSWDLPPESDAIKLREALHEYVNQPNGMMLRTMFLFQAVSNSWLQALIRPGKKQIECHIVTVADEEELELRVSEYANGRGSHRFTDGELLTRACIFQMNGYAQVLVWTLHHALMDRWSMENMTSDIERVYEAHPLPSRRPFKPMIKYLQHIDRTGGIEFWRKHLHNASPTPFLQGRSNARRVTANTIINRDIRGIDTSALTRRFGVMPSTLVACAWALVLSAHSNTTDIVFGQVLSGRNAPVKNIGTMTGIMINTIARRVLLDQKATVLEMLQRFQSEQFEISKHESISLAELQAEGIPVTTLFNTILNIWNRGFDSNLQHEIHSANDRLFAKPRKDGLGRLDYPLVVDVELGSTEFVCISSTHASELISYAETYVFLDHFESAIRFMVDHPEQSVIDVGLINDREKQLLIPAGPSVLVPNAYSESLSYSYPPLLLSVQNVCELIGIQVEKTPHRIALQFDQDVFLTYRQMDLLSNNLAWKLIRSGVQPGNLIAIYMDKSIEMILSILAIHKAGGGYVPLDPEYPADRIKTIINLSQAFMVLTTPNLKPQLLNIFGENGPGLLAVDFKDLHVDSKPDVKVTRDDVCHVLFTSGSTGIPKGVVLTHGSIIESALGSRELFCSFDGRVLQCVNYTFDVSVWDWSCTLTSGGTICIVPKQKLMDNLAAVASSFDITLLEVTPTVAGLLSPAQVPTLAVMILGGEMLSPEVRNKWASVVTLMNAYGATETSTNVTIMRKVTPSTDVSNIGRPFGLNFVYVLDENRRPVPLGCVGELYIGGPQVARGYLGAPEQTAKVFVDDPFRSGSIMYASGDLARVSPTDYSITYLGRRDTQIKIRGLRVEIGEIEATLKDASTDILNAAVIKAEAGSESLVAFLEYSPGPDNMDRIVIVQENEQFIGTLVASLRRVAQQRLAPYMVPTVYVPLNRFPLSSSGKLDRKALTAFFYAHQEEIRDLRLDSESFATLSSLEMPQDELQATLRTLWASILNLKENLLSIDDDFFLVGGDSISAIRLASAARDAGLSLPVIDIIRNSTIRRMAHIVQSVIPNDDYDNDETPTVTLEKMSPEDLTLLSLNENELDFLRTDVLSKYKLLASEVQDVYPATPTQAGHLLAGTTVHNAYVVPLAWDLPPKTDAIKLKKTFDDFINQPNGMMLRTVFLFHPVLKKWLQVLIKPGAKRMEWQLITVASEEELGLRVSEYELSRGSERFDDGQLLCRACIFQLDGYARVLVFTVHHALMDRWSTENMTSDLERAYANYPVPARRSFKPMIKYLQRDDRTMDIDFWKRHLHNAPPTHFLQGSSSATDAITFRDVHVDHISLVRRFGIMPSTLITCAWSIVLSVRCKSTDVVFGHILSGRNAPIKDIGTMCGIMINTVARRITLNPKATVLETLQQIQSDQLEISKHENICLTELEEEGVPISKLFHSLLNFRNKGFNQVIEHDGSPIEDRLFANLRKAARGTIEYPLCLDVDLRPTGVISIASFYASEIIPEADIRLSLDHFESALQFMIDHPENSTFELISDWAMRRLEANGQAEVVIQ